MDVPDLDAHVAGREELDLPRPVHSALGLAATSIVPLALGLADVIRPLSGLVFAGIFLGAAALQWSLNHFELAGIRRRADVELRRNSDTTFVSSLAEWRSRELTSDHHRLALARAVTRTRRALSPALLPGASPLNRIAVRPHAELLCRIADRLATLDLPVTPKGVLEVDDLLSSSDSPLYDRERAADVSASLLACLVALDAPPGPVRHSPTQQEVRA